MIGEQPPAPAATEAEPPVPQDAGAAATATDAPLRRRAAPPSDDDDDERSGFLSFLLELPVLIVVAFLLAFLLRTFVVQVFYIPSQSMEPTLMGHEGANDRILVDKITYRFREPRRGEIIVFEGESDPTPRDDASLPRRVVRGVGQLVGLAPANARDYVKRVIGLPGDRVRIDSNGHVFVNGEELAEPYVQSPDQQPCGPIVVPEGSLFFLGDNRSNSQDSRVVGFIDRDLVVGRAFVIMWPVERAEVLDRPEYGYIPPGEDPPPKQRQATPGPLC